MRGSWIVLAALLLLSLTACAAEERPDTAAEELQEKYARMSGCTARLRAAVATEEETRRYVLDVSCDAEETRVTVLEPEEISGICARISRADGLSLEYSGMVLDAGSAAGGVSAANCADVFLRAAAEGFVTERGRERFGDTDDALRLCFETEYGGEKLLVSAYFDAEDAPLYAEIEKDGKILAFLEFTDFTFGDILSSAQES
ncbi:MAG: hypothetical protein E7474_02530 [Ruminococcaceae bacterium]|nr:hypothetical protein [Oscillospiraceae bacterium]